MGEGGVAPSTPEAAAHKEKEGEEWEYCGCECCRICTCEESGDLFEDRGWGWRRRRSLVG